MSDWSEHPGEHPPSSSTLPGGWVTTSAAPLTEPPTYGSGPPLPALPVRRAPGADRNLVIAVVALAAALILAVAALVVISRRDPDVTAGKRPASSTSTSTTSTTAPSAPVGPGGGSDPSTTLPPVQPVTPPVTRPGGVPPTREQVDALVKEITAFVEKDRGLTFKTQLEVDLVSDAEFADRLQALQDETKDERVKTGRILQALGLADRQLDVAGTMAKLESIGVVAFYDVSSRTLVLRAVQLTPYLKTSLAREITRALDDAYFDLNRPQDADQKDEVVFGLRAVVAGDAARVEADYLATLSSADQEQRKREVNQFATDNPAPDVPSILFDVVNAPVDAGGPFVKKLLEHGGTDDLAAALREPPHLSAHVLHTDRWFAHDQAIAVDKPKAEGPEIADGIFGEELTRLMLGNDSDRAAADKAADGWGGDWYVLWDDGHGGSCIRIDYKMRTPQDLQELKDALTAWVQARGGRAAVDTNADQDTVELSSCSSAAGGGHNPA